MPFDHAATEVPMIRASSNTDKLDTDACAVRAFLVEDGELAWVDQHGRPTAAAGQSTPVFGRQLVRSTPTETAVQRARRERRERTAA
jgi:hypothetical protein